MNIAAVAVVIADAVAVENAVAVFDIYADGVINHAAFAAVKCCCCCCSY